MLRALGAFLVVFSVLSLVVHLNGLSGVFGAGALSVFGIDLMLAQFATTPRSSKMRGEPLF